MNSGEKYWQNRVFVVGELEMSVTAKGAVTVDGKSLLTFLGCELCMWNVAFPRKSAVSFPSERNWRSCRWGKSLLFLSESQTLGGHCWLLGWPMPAARGSQDQEPPGGTLWVAWGAGDLGAFAPAGAAGRPRWAGPGSRSAVGSQKRAGNSNLQHGTAPSLLGVKNRLQSVRAWIGMTRGSWVYFKA